MINISFSYGIILVRTFDEDIKDVTNLSICIFTYLHFYMVKHMRCLCEYIFLS